MGSASTTGGMAAAGVAFAVTSSSWAEGISSTSEGGSALISSLFTACGEGCLVAEDPLDTCGIRTEGASAAGAGAAAGKTAVGAFVSTT